ncbi:MAG: hypothetical protein GY723_13735 [bacterium]|nr:hypothetical protein [bacterium]MCP5069738.1 hypothetical protein [bacterium]
MIWVAHPDPRIQRFLARLVGETEALCGNVDDLSFEGAPAPRAIVLGVVDPGPALEFAQWASSSQPRARWVLVRDPTLDDEELARLFSGLDAVRLAYPPEPAALRAALRPGATDEAGETLPERRQREAIRSRFARYFQGLALPEPDHVQRAGRGLLVRGERGTGRLLFARAAHLLGGGERFVHLACDEATDAASLTARIQALGESRSLTICLEDLDRVGFATQRELLGWMELGTPGVSVPPDSVRWIALISEHGALFPDLIEALAALEVHLPPLRDRGDTVLGFVRETAAQWAADRGLERHFSEQAVKLLATQPWPGNLRELEAVVLRLISSVDGPTIEAEHVTKLIAPKSPREPLPLVKTELRPSKETPHKPQFTPPANAESPEDLQGLIDCLAHELRNPLVSIQTSAQLLPERFSDPEFRGRYHQEVQADVDRLGDLLSRLTRFASLGDPKPAPLDVTALLDRMLEKRRETIKKRHLLVLRELEADHPQAIVDKDVLVFVLECLLDRIVAQSSERADLYLASRPHQAEDGSMNLRILFRFHDGASGGVLSSERYSLSLWLARSALARGKGELHVDTGRGDETVVMIELPAPAKAANR